MRGAVAVQLVQAYIGTPGPHGRLVLVDVVREPGEQVQAGLGAADADLGQVQAELADQEVPLGAVAPAHGAQMAFQRGVLDERGQGDLVQGRRGHPGDQQHVLDVVDQVRRGDDPGQAQRGRERLARGPDEGDQVRRQALQGGHRVPAEPVLERGGPRELGV